jgi:hypothetical protein
MYRMPICSMPWKKSVFQATSGRITTTTPRPHTALKGKALGMVRERLPAAPSFPQTIEQEQQSDNQPWGKTIDLRKGRMMGKSKLPLS